MKWIAVSVSCLFAHPDLPVTLESLARRIRENPRAYDLRAERAWLLLEHGTPEGTVPEDIDSLSPHPDWSGHAARLKAYRLFLLGRNSEARTQVVENLKDGNTDGPEQLGLLSKIELAAKDTSSAINALNRAWEKRHEESDLLDLLALYRARSQAPGPLLEAGLHRHPQSPGVVEAVFSTYWMAGGREKSKRCLKITTEAVSQWPRSVDWKIRHARALQFQRNYPEAKKHLLAALELMDDSPRLDPNAKATAEIRKEIFNLLEAVKE